MNPNQSSNSTQQPVNPNPNVDRKDGVPPSPPVSGDNLTSGGQPPQTTVSKTPQGADAISGGNATTIPGASNPYVTAAPVPDSAPKNTTDSVKIMLGRWAKKAADATKKGQEYAGDMWQHLKTGPSITEAAVGRIAQGTKVLAEGGYEKIFVSTFQTDPNERFMKSYACYLSTSAGPIMGVIYISTAKLAFCSDNPLPYKVGEEKKWSYYKVVIPLVQLKAVDPSVSKLNPAEKFIQVISVDDHEFWFMGFVYYESAVKNLQGALDPRQHSLSVGSSD